MEMKLLWMQGGIGPANKTISQKSPKRKVYAVDIDSNMIKQARNNLQLFDNVEIIQASFTDIRLPQKLDVVFSNFALLFTGYKITEKSFEFFGKC
jgi:trans-aconitate methyltransferase